MHLFTRQENSEIYRGPWTHHKQRIPWRVGASATVVPMIGRRNSRLVISFYKRTRLDGFLFIYPVPNSRAVSRENLWPFTLHLFPNISSCTHHTRYCRHLTEEGADRAWRRYQGNPARQDDNFSVHGSARVGWWSRLRHSPGENVFVFLFLSYVLLETMYKKSVTHSAGYHQVLYSLRPISLWC